jgi:two-component system OmpR family sensor kinase
VIRRASLRWRLVAWVVAVMLVGLAIVFVVVYEQTGSQLRSRVDEDVRGDLAQLSDAVRTLRPSSSDQLLADLRRYLRAQPYRGRSSLLFARVPGRGTATNHPELFGGEQPDDGESVAQQSRENVLGQALLRGPLRLLTTEVPDVGQVRVDERLIRAHGQSIRVGAGEALESVTTAQRSVAGAFLIAGAIGLTLVLVASYLAGASVSRPLRRMARVAARVDDGDLDPRMEADVATSREIRTLADAFNHMLDRLAAAFGQQRDFVADASHELRTPLTVIAGQLEVLAAQPDPSAEEVRRVQRVVAGEVARTSRLVDDMLLLARSEQREFVSRQELDLPAFVTELWTTSTAGAQRRLELGPVPAGVVAADPDRLAQALRNLIDNALAHTAAPDGHVGCYVETRDGGRLRFTVVDDGPGIPEDQRERIFERFHRTDEGRDRRAGGAGLGLAIVQAIAEAHGGRARAVDPHGAGARLQLEITGFSQAADGDRPATSEQPGAPAR